MCKRYSAKQRGSSYFEKDIVDNRTLEVRTALVRSTIHVCGTDNNNVAHCYVGSDRFIKWLD